ncbi:MAG TPA: acyltransferase, partial [Gammaproteobacteria bacterium]|nr:acyltransferase [Gammaproteobacteria bacterium]
TVSWSLSVEMFFYVAFLALRHLSDRQLYALTTLSCGLLIFMISIPHPGVDPYWAFYINPVARLPEFLSGMTLYRLYRSGALVNLPAPRFDFLLLAVFMLLAAAFLGSRGIGVSWFYSIIPLPFCILMMVSLLGESHNRYMTNPTLVLLGEASFGLYLIHHPIIDFFNLLVRKHAGVEAVLLQLVAVALCVVSSVVFYMFIESRLTRALKAFFMGRAVSKMPSPLVSE